MSWRRAVVPGVRALELWDTIVDGRPLYERVPGGRGAALAGLIREARGGTVRTASAGRVEVPPFDAVALTGGAIEAVAADVPVVSFGDRWLGWRGARAVDAGAAAMIDVGQSAIKVAWDGHVVELPRDLARLPVVTPGRPPEPDRRGAFVSFVGKASALAPPGDLVCALPTELDADGRAHGCSYPFPVGDRALLADLAATRVGRWTFLNDAELAAVAVRDAAPARRWLVLTLGFGVGGAWAGPP